MASNTTIAIGVIVVIVIIAAAFFLYGSGPAAQSGGGTTPQSGQSLLAVQITDPPQVPAHTQSLVVAYSSVQVHTSGGAGSGWVSATGSGSIDLMAVLNLSQTIATASVANGTTVDMVRFNVTSAKITINGTTYNVTVPSSTVTAKLTGESRVNGTNKALLQLSPVVATIVTENSTVFVLVPSVKAVIVGSSSASLSVGARESLRADEEDRLNSTASVSITGASLLVSGNTTKLSVTVSDSSNSSVVIKHIGVFGNESVLFNKSAIVARADAQANESLSIARERLAEFCSNVNKSASTSGSVNGIVRIGALGSGSSNNTAASSEASDVEVEGGYSVHVNGSICTAASAAFISTLSNQINSQLINLTAKISSQQESARFFAFIVAGNSTLITPSAEGDFESSGYTLQAGQSHTFTFTGKIAPAQGHIVIVPKAGSVYKIGVQGEEGAFASTNVTASSG